MVSDNSLPFKSAYLALNLIITSSKHLEVIDVVTDGFLRFKDFFRCRLKQDVYKVQSANQIIVHFDLKSPMW